MKRYLVELMGAFALVFCGTGAIVINDVSNGSITHIGIAITFGLIVMAMIYTFGSIAGAHINPAVSIAPAVVSGDTSLLWLYTSAPTIGALLASGTWKGMEK